MGYKILGVFCLVILVGWAVVVPGLSIYGEITGKTKENRRAEFTEFYQAVQPSEEQAQEEFRSRLNDLMQGRELSEALLGANIKDRVLEFSRPVQSDLHMETDMEDFLRVMNADVMLNGRREREGKDPLPKEMIFKDFQEEALAAASARFGNSMEVFSDGTVRLGASPP